MKILMAQLNLIVGDLKGNQKKILNAIEKGKKEKCDLVVTSELALTGYPPEDLVLLSDFVNATQLALNPLIEASKGIGAIIGTIRANPFPGKPLYNSAAICFDGKLLGYQDKTLLPTYDVFDETRYFAPAENIQPWKIGSHTFGITICEDMWQFNRSVKETNYPQDPIQELNRMSVDCFINLSASPYHVGKFAKRMHLCQSIAHFLKVPFVYVNQVGGNDSLIFDGRSAFLNAQGDISTIAKAFEEDLRVVDLNQTKAISYQVDNLQDLYQALVLGLRDYFYKSGFKEACIGLSGGIDSALVACLAVDALGNENVHGIGMPSIYSSPGSIIDAKELAHNLKISFTEIPINAPYESYLTLLEPFFKDKKFNTTEENIQARIRGMILMALSNKHGWIVLSTGNKSELALGYSTLYGDLCGGLSVISDLTKQQVYALSRWINRNKKIIPQNSLEKPPSAELRPNQKDSDSLPDYAIVDAVLKDYIESNLTAKLIAEKHNFPLSLVEDLIKRIHRHEYKRRQAPPGLRVTEKAFSDGRHFPIVQKWT